MVTTSDNVSHMILLNPYSKEYLDMRKQLTPDELVSLKKLLRKRSDERYKLKKNSNKMSLDNNKISELSATTASGVQSSDDMSINVRLIKDIVSDMLKIMKTSNSSESRTTITPSASDIIESYNNDNMLSHVEILTNLIQYMFISCLYYINIYK
jgi:hypothetical protein